MELPPALFEAVTSTPATSNDPALDQPLANWVFLGQKTILLRHPSTGQTACSARIRRISIQGIGLLVEQAISVGEAFALQLPRHGRAAVTVRCAAVRCEAGGDGLYRIGAVYTDVLSDEYQAPEQGARACGHRPIRAATLAA